MRNPATSRDARNAADAAEENGHQPPDASDGGPGEHFARRRGRSRVLKVLLTISRSGRGRAWAIVAWLTLLAFLAGTVVGAATFVANAHQANSASFDRSVTEVSATASLDLERIEDLAVATAAFVAQSPNFTSADFRLWAGSVYRPGRIPGVSALLFVRYVPAKELSAYASSVKPPGAFKLVPQGRYPYYCFIPEGDAVAPRAVVTKGVPQIPAESLRSSELRASVDLCSTAAGPLLLRAAHQRRAVSGKFVIGGATAFVLVPVFHNGALVKGTASNLDELLGWAGVFFEGNLAARSIATGQSHIGLALSTFNDLQGNVEVGGSGVARKAPYHATKVLHLESNWSLSVYGTSASNPVVLDLEEALILFGGAAVALDGIRNAPITAERSR